MTIQWLSNDYLMTIQWLSKDYPMTSTKFWSILLMIISACDLGFWIWDLCTKLGLFGTKILDLNRKRVNFAWLSLCFILETRWVALFSVCEWVSECVRHRCHPAKSPLFQYIQAYKPFAYPVTPNTKKCQLILTKNQPVSSYTDPVPSSTTYNSSFDESRTVYLV